jgi:hypothetical protein
MFHTLQEFMTFTKGTSYILAGAFLLFFIFFWYFLTERDPKK